MAYVFPESALAAAVKGLAENGRSVVLTLTLPVATVVFFDTTPDIGVYTELIGLTAAGDDFMAPLRSGAF